MWVREEGRLAVVGGGGGLCDWCDLHCIRNGVCGALKNGIGSYWLSSLL
jgi:hypothetical protein